MKKYKNIIKYISIFIIIMIFQMFLPLDLDEIWNYGFANNIASGLIPYKDFNMVMTPFFSFLYFIPLFFHSNLYLVQIEHTLLILFSFYLLEKMYNQSAYFFLILFFCLWNCIYPSYNSLLIILTIILGYLEEKNKNDYLIGILLGIIILTKQSVGLCMLLVSLLYYRKDYKKVLKRLGGSLIPILIFIIYLMITNSYHEFFDLCILGLFDFGKENRLEFNITYILFALSVLIILYLIKKDKNNINYWYSLGFLSITVPMFDIGHFRYFIIVFFSLVVIPKINIKRISIPIVTMFSMIGITTFVFLQCFTEEKKFYFPNKVNHFEYKYISKEHEQQLNRIINLYNKYDDKNIVFIGRSSYFYKIIADKKITYLDLINTGNWGYHGSEKIKTKINSTKDPLFVVDITSFHKYEQSDKTALNYIKKNYKKIDKMDEFELYIEE